MWGPFVTIRFRIPPPLSQGRRNVWKSGWASSNLGEKICPPWMERREIWYVGSIRGYQISGPPPPRRVVGTSENVGGGVVVWGRKSAHPDWNKVSRSTKIWGRTLLQPCVSNENVGVQILWLWKRGSECYQILSHLYHKIRQSKINSRSVPGPMGQMNRRPSIWCSKYYFFSWFLAEFFAKILSIYFFKKKYKN